MTSFGDRMLEHHDPGQAAPFGARLRSRIDERGPLCVGIDPLPELLAAWNLADSPAGLAAFCDSCVEAICTEVAVVKPQSAFFERHGSAGIAVLERLIAAARDAGALVLLDAKRGDIGTTVQGYADAYLDPASSLAVDAITASPYLGFGSLRPLFDMARTHGAGVFVLALTSNPEGPQVQGARNGASTVAGSILSALATENAGQQPLGSFGAVVAANLGSCEEDLAINGPLLAPGFGAQGGTPDDVRRIFGPVLSSVLPSTSRQVLAAGPDRAALRRAVLETSSLVRTALSA